MNVADIFIKYKLNLRSGASLENALSALCLEIQSQHEKEQNLAFIAGVKAAVEQPYEIDTDDESALENLADEYGYPS